MMTIRKTLAAAVCAIALGVGAQAQGGTPALPDFAPTVGQSGKDVVWVPTAQTLVDSMLEMAGLTQDDILYDLGSGDGRMVITAAKRGARAHGIEYNPDMVALSIRAAEAEGVAGRATFKEGDIFESDFSEATVVSLFLLPNLNLRLRPILLDMKPGTRVVSNAFDMAEWQPDDTVQVTEDCSGYCTAYKWVVPAKVEGNWKFSSGQELVLTQTFQMLEGELRHAGKASPISEARMDGARITFTADGARYTARVEGDRMQGTADGASAWSAQRAVR